MSLERTNKSLPALTRQDQIQWGIVFLTRKLRNLSPEAREQCLQEVWAWGRAQADLLCLQMIRAYRECCKASGPAYIRHREWFWNNRRNPEFWKEWDKRFPGREVPGKAADLRAGLRPE